ncbi:unnamed protein product [Arctogadus glacialis]
MTVSISSSSLLALPFTASHCNCHSTPAQSISVSDSETVACSALEHGAEGFSQLSCLDRYYQTFSFFLLDSLNLYMEDTFGRKQ